MFNVGGGELLVILLLALIVLGPTKLPEAARYFGKATRELRRLSGGFQTEMQQAMDSLTVVDDDPVEAEARARGEAIQAADRTRADAERRAKRQAAASAASDGTADDTAESSAHETAEPTAPAETGKVDETRTTTRGGTGDEPADEDG